MPAYVIGELQTADPAPLQEYLSKVFGVIERHGGRVVAGGRVAAVLEGDLQPSSATVIEFDSARAALDWYESEDYRAIRGLRQASGRTSVIVLDATPDA